MFPCKHRLNGLLPNWRTLAAAAVLLWFSVPASSAAAASKPTAPDPVPTAYRVELTIDPSKTQFTGNVEIDVDLATPQQAIRLNGRDLSMTRVAARSAGVTIPGTYKQIDEAGHAQVQFELPLPAGRVTLSFTYSAPFRDGPGGLFRANVDGDWYVWSELFPDASRAYPCFNQLAALTPVTVSIIAPRGMTAVSSAPETATTSSGMLTRHSFSPSPPKQTWDVVIAVGPFVSEDTVLPPNTVRNRPLPVRVSAPRSQAGKLSFALSQSSVILQQLEDYLQVPYPYPKLDQLTSPLLKGGLSGGGAVHYGSDFFVLAPQDPVQKKQRFAKIVAHELAHQWFGNMLMAGSWGDFWIAEGFANFLGPKVVSRWRPEWSQATFAAYPDMDREMLPGQVALHQHLTAETAPRAYTFAYGKGSQVLAMMNTYLGEQRLRAGIRTLIERHRFQTITSADVIQDIAAGSGERNAAPILDSYLNQPGLPLLSLRRQGNSLQIGQKPARDVSGQQHLWTIPFCYRQGENKTCEVLSKESTNISLSHPYPVIPNVSGSGYYRFDMPDEDWARIVELLPSLPACDALAINDSLWAAFRFRSIDARRLVDAMQVMANSSEPSVVLDGANRWAALRNLGVVSDQADADYSTVLREIYSPPLRALGAELQLGRYVADDPKRQLTRVGLVQTLALEGHDEQLTQRLRLSATEFLAGNGRALDPAFLSTALTAHARAGGQPVAEAVLKAAVKDQKGVQRPLILRALGSVDDAKIAAWIISQLGHSGLRPADEMDLVQELLAHPRSRDVASRWAFENYKRLAALGINRGWGVPIFTVLCSAEDADKVEALFTVDGKKPEDSLVASTAATIRACAALRTTRSDDVARALKPSRS